MKICQKGSTIASGLPENLVSNVNTSSFPMDASSSIKDLSILFLATMVDAKEFLGRLEAKFCKEIWPAFCSQIDDVRNSNMELQKSVDQQKARNCTLLSENVVLQAALKQETSRLDSAVQKATEAGMTGKMQKALQKSNELRESLEQYQRENGELQHRLHSLQGEHQDLKQSQQKLNRENEELRKQVSNGEQEYQALQRRGQRTEDERCRLEKSFVPVQQANLKLSNFAEDREKNSNISETKVNLLEKENERPNENQGATEKIQVLRNKRLSLKRDELPNRSRHISSQATKSQVQVLASSTNGYDREVLKPLPSLNLQHEEKEVGKIEGLRQKMDEDLEGEAAVTPAQCNDDVDNQPQRPRSPFASNGGDAKTDSLRLAGSPDGPSPAGSMHICKQQDEESNPQMPPAGVVDSDETTMDMTQSDRTEKDAEKPFIIPIDTSNRAVDENQALQLASSLHASLEVDIPNEGDGTSHQTRACLHSTATRSFMTEVGPDKRDVETKSKARIWRRPRGQLQSRTGDPHDNFLDTPLEQIRAQLATDRHQDGENDHPSIRKQVGHIWMQDTKLEVGNDLKEERKGKNALGPKRSSQSYSKSNPSNVLVRSAKANKSKPSKNAGGFKFNEPVRKKRDRENLAATDCRECSKFYNALEAEDANGAMPLRCEHHDAVSRHRFQNIPKSTPDGFWNIGFSDS